MRCRVWRNHGFLAAIVPIATLRVGDVVNRLAGDAKDTCRSGLQRYRSPKNGGSVVNFYRLLKTRAVTVTALTSQDPFMRMEKYGPMVANCGKTSRSMVWRPLLMLARSRYPVISDGSLRISCSRHNYRRHSPNCGHRRDAPGDRSGCRDRSGAHAVCSSRYSIHTGIRHNSRARRTRYTDRHSSHDGSVCHAGAGADDGRRGGAPWLPGMSHE